MSQVLDIARSRILEPAGLIQTDLDKAFANILSHTIDSADLYFQFKRQESWTLEDGSVKHAGHSIDQGVGVRAISGDKTGFAYSDEVVLPALLQAAQGARAIAQQGVSNNAMQVQALQSDQYKSLYDPLDPVETLSADEKIRLLELLDREARQQDARIKEVTVSLTGLHDVILVASSDGTLVGDVRPLVRLNVSVIAEQNGRREQATSGGGGRVAYGYFQDEDRALDYAREAVRQALIKLDAVDAPAGAMTVVLGPGWPGILLHEAVGHGLEGISIAKARQHLLGEWVRKSLLNIVRSLMMAPSISAVVRSVLMMKARRLKIRCSLRTVFSKAICKIR